MKKHTCTILLAVLLISSASYAQKTRWGIQAGATYSNITFSYDGEVESDDYKPGFTAGIMMDRKIGKSVFFQSALNFVQKGTQTDDNSVKTSATFWTKGIFSGVTCNISQVDVSEPLRLRVQGASSPRGQ